MPLTTIHVASAIATPTCQQFTDKVAATKTATVDPSHLLGLYLLSSSSSVSLRMVMTLTGGLGVSGMMMG